MAFKTILKSGLQASYDAITTKDPDVLYFCTDTQKIYKGEVDYTNSVVPAATRPANPAAGKVYILADTNTVEAYVGDAWVVLSYPTATTINDTSDDLHVATAKAVYDAISSLASSANTVKSVEAGTDAAKVKVTLGDDSSSEFVVPNVVTTPTWDATERKLTLPVTGGTAVEVNLGKDIFLDPDADNKYNEATQCIELYLNDGDGSTESTKIEIPAADLIDVYTGGTTNGASVTVASDNTITVDLTIDPDSNNALVLTGNGLKVDLSGLTSRVSTLETSVTKLTGDGNTEGSVDYKIAEQSAIINNTINELATATTSWGTF